MMKPKHVFRALRSIPRRVRWMLAGPVVIAAAFAIDADAGFASLMVLTAVGVVRTLLDGERAPSVDGDEFDEEDDPSYGRLFPLRLVRNPFDPSDPFLMRRHDDADMHHHHFESD
ncbi:hypothetical protein CKO25_04410 [Thiocapsa imhoffii]|uniref:Uncharacterized protein n=1 Tax=Thiocapsa imhoffii TaxID=382777 RepID=A0A9X0WGV5_9GAMM|nr:hypothetical protein [Thiocapsa imhoffii]MBK1643912.1 hypothetical protein [Thiocapsa imhoffii]